MTENELQNVKIKQALVNVRKDIIELFCEPPRYVPNHEAYKRCLEVVDEHLKGVINEHIQ